MSSDDLDPTIRRFQQQIAAAYAAFPGFGSMSNDERRRVGEQVRAPWRIGGPPMRRTDELTVGEGNVRIRILRPSGAATLPALLYLHGGGWTLFSIDSHDRLMREYAARAGIAVIGIDYSLSPEVRYPTALQEILSVIAWLREHGADHGIDASRLAIGGDSAGANLATAASLALRDSGRPNVSALLLNYGAFAYDHGGDSYSRFDGDAYNLTAAEMGGFWRGYVRDEKDFADPLVNPLLADVSGLPPSFFTIAACDILADENVALAERLREAGVSVEAEVYEGATHSFLEAVSISPLADRALDDASQWLRERLAFPAILMIGAGRMGQAFLRRWADFGGAAFFDPAVEQVEDVRKLRSLEEAAGLARPLVIVIAVKPQMLSRVLPDLARFAAPDLLFVSIAAGTEISALRRQLGEAARVVRAMPNTPVAVGKGVTAAICGPGVDAAQRALAQRLFEAVGDLIWLENEALLDAVTAVSGSGPAYFFRFAEALARAGTGAGLAQPVAFRLARATLAGSGAVAAERDDLAALRVEVTSPGGTTAAALAALDGADLDRIMADAVAAAVARARELARETA